MLTYAILGATGATGRQLTNLLLDKPDSKVHLYARSASKLNNIFPSLSDHTNTNSFIGDLSNKENMINCLDGADVIFSTVSQNANEPGCSIVQQNAQAIVKALEILRKRKKTRGQNWLAPRVVLLAAMPLIPEEQVPRPWLFYNFLYSALYYVYEDLKHAVLYLQSEGERTGLLHLVTACPGGLIDGKPAGYELGLQKESPGLTYADLAAAMIEMGEEDEWVGKFVGIEGKGSFAIGDLFGNLWRFILPGLIVTFLPWLYGPLRRFGLFQMP